MRQWGPSTCRGRHQSVLLQVHWVQVAEAAVVVDELGKLGKPEIVPIELDRCQVGVEVQRDCPAEY